EREGVVVLFAQLAVTLHVVSHPVAHLERRLVPVVHEPDGVHDRGARSPRGRRVERGDGDDGGGDGEQRDGTAHAVEHSQGGRASRVARRDSNERPSRRSRAPGRGTAAPAGPAATCPPPPHPETPPPGGDV